MCINSVRLVKEVINLKIDQYTYTNNIGTNLLAHYSSTSQYAKEQTYRQNRKRRNDKKS